MTHDELLARMAEPAHNLNANDARNIYLLALRAVVELHKPADNSKCVCQSIFDPWGDEESYPCPTIQAIEKELK